MVCAASSQLPRSRSDTPNLQCLRLGLLGFDRIGSCLLMFFVASGRARASAAICIPVQSFGATDVSADYWDDDALFAEFRYRGLN